MRICSKCKEDKDISEYNKKSNRKDGLQPYCKTCSHARFKKYYEDNKEKQKAYAIKRSKKVLSENKTRILAYLNEHPCVDCGESDPVVLEFDHVRGIKRAHVSILLREGHKWDTIMKEIDKCEVRCCNCHRRKTSKLFGSYRVIK